MIPGTRSYHRHGLAAAHFFFSAANSRVVYILQSFPVTDPSRTPDHGFRSPHLPDMKAGAHYMSLADPWTRRLLVGVSGPRAGVAFLGLATPTRLAGASHCTRLHVSDALHVTPASAAVPHSVKSRRGSRRAVSRSITSRDLRWVIASSLLVAHRSVLWASRQARVTPASSKSPRSFRGVIRPLQESQK